MFFKENDKIYQSYKSRQSLIQLYKVSLRILSSNQSTTLTRAFPMKFSRKFQHAAVADFFRDLKIY